MSVECKRYSIKLGKRVNGGRFNLTEKGQLIHELIRLDIGLRNNFDPSIAYAMSSEMVERDSLRVNELSVALGFPLDTKKRSKKLNGYSLKFKQIGQPHWRN